MENNYTPSRSDEYKSGSKNPCTRFLAWNSNNKCFTYYDKEKKEDVKVELPIKFIVLKELSTVKGWHGASTSGIYSNEVVNLGVEELSVRSFKGGDIVKGIYSDIKTTIIANGGHYEKSIYALDAQGELINIALKKSGVGAWSSFMEKEGKKRSFNEWIIVDRAIDEQSGGIKYSIPSFEYLKEMSAEEVGDADVKYKEFMEYFNSYSNNTKTKEETND